jgi:tetratricopeptide (TPR) repeat protein
MSVPKFFKHRKKRIWFSVGAILVLLILSVYFAVKEPAALVGFLNQFFAPGISKVLPIVVPIIAAVFIGLLVNFLSADVTAALDEPKAPDRTPEQTKIPVEVVVRHEYENPVVPPVLASDPAQKFYPNYFLPELKFFVGRREVLQEIENALAQDHRAAIHDIPGLGKTFTTFKFAEENQDRYEKIFFVRASREEMLESLAKCGELVEPQFGRLQEQQAKALGFKQWLEENENWLVIYDNVDVPKELFPFVPVNKNGDCLFTSNSAEVAQLRTEIGFNKLGPSDAGILLFSRAKNSPNSVPELEGEEKVAFDCLIAEIDGLPLTLNSTGAAIGLRHWTFTKFWQRYQKTPEIAWDSEDSYSVYSNRSHRSAGKVFSLIYDELTATGRTGDAVKLLLDAICFLAPDEIPEELLQAVLRDRQESFVRIDDPEAYWDDVRDQLTNYDLLKYNAGKAAFSTHRAIQRVLQTKTDGPAKQVIAQGLMRVLVSRFPDFDYANRAFCEEYFAHVEALLGATSNLPVENQDMDTLACRAGTYQRLLGNFLQAEKAHQRAVAVSAKVWGAESTAHATNLNELAIIYRSQGRYDEAIVKYEESLRIAEKTIGREHPAYAARLSNLGLVYELQGRSEEAIAMYEAAQRIDEKTIGKEHPDYATRLGNLGLIYTSLGRYEEAVAKYEEALRIDEKTIGREHPYHATRLNNLGLVYKSLGRYDEAGAKFEEALRIDEKTIGKEHPDYAAGLNNLGGVYQSTGRYDEAIAKFGEALRIGEKTLGREHPDYAIALSNLARVYEDQENYGAALELYEEALRIDLKTLPPNHSYTGRDRESVERSRGNLK